MVKGVKENTSAFLGSNSRVFQPYEMLSTHPVLSLCLHRRSLLQRQLHFPFESVILLSVVHSSSSRAEDVPTFQALSLPVSDLLCVYVIPSLSSSRLRAAMIHLSDGKYSHCGASKRL